MDSDPKNFFNLLYECLEDERRGPNQCDQLLYNMNDFLTKEQVNSSYLDLYLQQMFGKSDELHIFVMKIINQKPFRTSVKKILEIIYTLINNCARKMEKYTFTVHKICMKVVKSTLVSSDETVKALNVLCLSFEKINKSWDNPNDYNAMYQYLVKSTANKKCNTVTQNLLVTLGTFAKHCEFLVENPESLRNVFFNFLESQMIKTDGSNGLICGAFTGLKMFCEAFPLDPHVEGNVPLIDKLYKYIEKLVVAEEGSIKIANRAALTFLASNVPLFVAKLTAKYNFWHESLLKWLNMVNPEDQKVGVFTLDAFYRGLNDFLQTDPTLKHITLHFYKYFKTHLDATQISCRERKSCLQGLYAFAPVITIHLDEEDVHELVRALSENFERTYVVDREPPTEVLDYLPMYLQTVVKYSRFKTSCAGLNCLQKGSVTMIKTYPQLNYSSHDSVVRALVLTFYVLSNTNERLCDDFIESVIYQGVVWTSSHQHVSQTDVEADKNATTVRSFSGLWKGLLGILPQRQYDREQVFLDDRRYVLIKVVDKLIKTMLVLINKLDVSVVTNESAGAATDLERAYRASQANDFAIFLNVVDFYQEILAEVEPTFLDRCVPKLVVRLVVKCRKHALISGFYKLLASCLRICGKIGYFHRDLETDACYMTLRTFADCLVKRTQQFKGDLLIACLQVLLELPPVIVRQILPMCVPSFKTIFTLGRTYTSLADVALDALERWQDELDIDALLVEVLPLLDCYLQSKFTGMTSRSGVGKRKTAQALKKRKIVAEIEPELSRLQMKVLRFVGSQKSGLCRAFAAGEVETALIGRHHLKVVLPYGDVKLEVFLDKLVPKVCALAVNCTDRKTRMVACELLQACVVVFLGTTKQMSQSGSSDLNALLRHIAVPLLQLGCDPDRPVEELFRLLCFQLIHWYTHASQAHSEHSAIIIEALLESIAHPTDTALRDFSGRCINEFVTWTIKQTSERQLAEKPTNIKTLVKRMRFYGTHPDPFKKLGAALIFNNIYREMREEKALLSMFWPDLVHLFVTSLATCELDDEDGEWVTQIESALTHLERGFVEKANVFNAADANRRVPTDIGGPLLEHVAVWVLRQTGASSSVCRKRCMELFVALAPRCRGFQTLRGFVAERLTPDWVAKTYEAERIEDDGIKWMEAFECALDGYCFVLNHGLGGLLSETLVASVRRFTDNVADKSLDGAVTTNFNRLKTRTLRKLLQLLTLVDEVQVFLPMNELVLNIIFNRHVLGFEPYADISDLVLVLKKFLQKLDCQNIGTLRGFIVDYITCNLGDFDVKGTVGLTQRNIIKGLNLVESLKIDAFRVQEFGVGMTEDLLSKFVALAHNGVIVVEDLHDTTLSHCLSILEFALNTQTEFIALVDHLFQPLVVQMSEYKQPVAFGIYIADIFEEAVAPKVAQHLDLFVRLGSDKSATMTAEIIVKVVKHVVKQRGAKSLQEDVSRCVLSNWELCVSRCFDDWQLGMELVRCLHPLVKFFKLDTTEIKKWLCGLLGREKKPIWKEECDLKVEVFYLLVDYCDEDNIPDLDQALTYLKTKCLTNEATLESKTLVLGKLICAAPKIKSAQLFVFLLDLYVAIPSEAIDIRTVLADFMLSYSGNQTDILERTYNLMTSSHLDWCQKHKLIANATPIFQYCTRQVFEDFFAEHTTTTLAILAAQTTDTNLADKTVQFALLELVFARCATQTKNKSLLAKILKSGFDAVKEAATGAAYRVFRCHAYNALVSVTCNSLRDENFFTKLFVRLEDGEDVLWKGLVDCEKTYVFGCDFESIPKRRKVLLNIRRELKATKTSPSVRYLQSMRLYNSSLSEDVARFDFNENFVRSATDEDVEDVVGVGEIELDCTEVDGHECMASVCGLIQHVVGQGIVELPDEDADEYVVPAWINGIRALLLNPGTHDNVKIFWVKVVDNTIHEFRRFGRWFLEPLLKFVVDKCAGSGINYFISDVVAILASWAKDVVPSSEAERHLASNMLAFLITNLDNHRQDIFKYHLDLVRLLVEAWKACVSVPYDLIAEKLTLDKKKVVIGVHVASIFLANGIAPWSGSPVDFCKALFNIVIRSDRKSTYQPCAETIGLALRVAQKHAMFSKLLSNVDVLLKKIDQKGEDNKHPHVLEAVTLHYPGAANEHHLTTLLSRLHGVAKSHKLVFLRVLLARCDVLGAVADFTTEPWEKYVETGDVEVQIVAMEIVHKCLRVLSASNNFAKIVEAVCGNVGHSNVLCRSKTFDIAMAVLELGRAEDVCRRVLVQGLVDPDEEIRAKVYAFWTGESQLSETASDRFAYILANLYEPMIENDFLGYGAYLLLDSVKKREEYDALLFAHPLEDCDFEEYRLETGWRTRHASVVPLFAETQKSQTSEEVAGEWGQLRQTQTAREFVHTQSVRAREMSQYTLPESSLYVKNEEFVDPNRVVISERFRVPKRRFLRDREKINAQYAQKEVKKSAEKGKERQEAVKERESKVTMYRKYRKGDLPDVQITLQGVVEPLQVLALYDGEVSKTLYSELFKTILSKMRGDVDYLKRISAAIGNIFSCSTQFNRNLCATLLEVLIVNKTSFAFPPEVIVSVSQSSGLRTLGILLLEENLISYVAPTSSKRPCGSQISDEVKTWIKLAELYKEIDEWDAVKSIFLEKNECPDAIKQALACESQKQWQDAQDLYRQLLTSDANLERRDFYYDSYFKCFAHLGDWSRLSASIELIVDAPDAWAALWDRGFNQHKLLPWYVDAQLKSALFTQKTSPEFVANLNAALNSDKVEYLRAHFSEQIAMFWVHAGELDEAEHYVRTYLSGFLERWQQLEPFHATLRHNKTLKLRNVVDIERFIRATRADDVAKLLGYWKRTADDVLPTILLSEERVLYRRQFLKSLADKIDVRDVKAAIDDAILDAAIHERNFAMTKKYMIVSGGARKKLGLSKLASIKASMLQDDAAKLKVLIQGGKNLHPVLEEGGDVELAARIQMFKQLNEIAAIVGGGELERCVTEIRGGIAGDGTWGMEQLRAGLEAHAGRGEAAQIAAGYTELALFAKDTDPFAVFVLRAMKFGSEEAKQLFPCVLMREFSVAEFLQESDEVPAWMFLGWIPQILSKVDTSLVAAVAPLLLRIATAYPQAIMFHYRLSKENYSLENEASKELVQQLDELLLGDERIDKFLQALSFVAVPATIVTYFLAKLAASCEAGDLEQLGKITDFVLRDVYGFHPNSRDEEAMQGNAFKDIKQLKETFEKIQDLAKKNKLCEIKSILIEARTKLKPKSPSKLLKDYSPWLSNFSGNKLNLDLEIPGQYDGKRMPLTEYHVKISGFNPTVSVMNSIRKPIKVTILGNDSRDYPFLVKFGEDVRQDQRIEQLFVLMNTIFANDKSLGERDFNILTYQVIPLSSRLGLIQWIEDTQPLGDLFTRDELDKAYDTYERFIHKSKKQGNADAYGKAAVVNSKEKTVGKFRQLASTLEWDVLRKRLRQLSADLEGFFALRANFVRSYAVMCAGHWILGIGDRHLNNSLVNTRNGKVLGIDFGHAFGTATQVLSVPELVPFRLTPQLVHLMEPLGERGPFREAMVHSLRVLRANSATLLATMNVFIEEPSIDWVEHASRFSDRRCEWYPAQKIDQAKRKLEGANSASVLVEDLKAGHIAVEYLNAYVNWVEGSEEDLRARMGQEGLSVEEQVDCLIEHASDYNLLGRMFQGWRAWV